MVKRGGFKKYAEGNRERTILRQIGKWYFYNEEGELTKIVYYQRGKVIKEKVILEFFSS